MAKKRRGWVGVYAFGLALAVGVVWPTPARAINIVIQLQNEGENPSWDASGSQLQAAFNAAAQIWERLLPGGGTYEVDVWWEDLDDGTLGQWSPECCGDNNIRIDPTPKTSGGDNFTWWVDPTPLENSEFDFTNGSNYQGITLYEDLTGSQQGDWFIGPVPAVLEVGYRGFANASGPSGSNQLDLLSTLIHELGHELGVNGEFDGEMELNASHVGGANNVAALEDNEGGHLAVESALMCAGCGSANLRRLPSAVDVLAAAEDQGISSVDLKRKHFISGSSWGTASNWIGGRVPDINDEVFIVHGGNVSLTSASPTDMQSLVIDQQSQVSTGSRHMRVATSVLIEGGNSKLVIGSGGLFENTSIQSGVTLETGVIDLDGGTARISFLTSNTGHVEGHGTFELLHNFQNNGTVSAEDNGTLDITGSILLPTDKLDLDGDGPSESGSVKAINGNIRIFHPMPEDDPFDGFMQIGAGRSILVGPWTLGAGGVLLLDGSPTQDATLGENSFSPRDHELYGIVIVDGRGVVNPTSVRFNSTSNIQMPGSEDILILNSPDTAFTGGTYLGNGVLRQGGDFTVESDTTFNMNTFDWGNSTSTQDNLLRVNSGATLTINSTGSGTSGNPYRGRITLDSGVLDVGFTNGWTLASADRSLPDGTMLIRNFGGPTPEIKGEHFTVDSFMEVVGGLAIVSADLTTTANADIYVHAGGTLQLFGYSIFNQGYFNTAPGETGTIRQSGNIDVVGDVYMDVATYDWGNGYRVNGINVSHRTLIGQDVLFAVRAASTGTAGNPYHGDLVILGGQLHTEFDNPWTLPAATGNPLSGAPRGVINFSYNFFTFEHTTGLITGQEFNVGGDINVLENPLNPNSAEIHANVTFLDTAAVNLASNTDLSLFGTTTFLGGSFTGAGTLAQGANFTVNADTTIDVQEFDWGNSLSALNMRQLLVNNGATFTINSQDLGDPDAKFRGILRLHGGHLTVNTPGGWLIPSGSAIGPPVGLLELQTVNGINPTVNGTLLTVAGKLTVDDAPSTTAIINADVSLLSNSTIDIGPGSAARPARLEPLPKRDQLHRRRYAPATAAADSTASTTSTRRTSSRTAP
ncbi:MAG: hypothetical protein R3C45_20195 [Phycisphaerales bacterium]